MAISKELKETNNFKHPFVDYFIHALAKAMFLLPSFTLKILTYLINALKQSFLYGESKKDFRSGN